MIEWMKADFDVAYLCAKLGVSESGFHASRSRPQSPTAARREELNAKVLGLFIESGRADGHRKIAVTLHTTHGVHANPKTVLQAMRRMGLMPPAAVAAFRRAAARAQSTPDPEDLLDRRFDEVTEPGTVLVGDITYVPTGQGWVYLATVIDLASRKVLGWASGKRQTAELAVTALRRGFATGHVAPGAIFHSDHGAQYRSRRFARFCGRHGIRRSMGKNFECWDNAVAESFFSKLKNERLRWRRFTTRGEAIWEINDYIHHFNDRRPHQTLGYATPAETLTRLTTQTPTADAA